MGITRNCTDFLFYAKSLGVSFEKTLMLGRLLLYVKPAEIRESMNNFLPGSIENNEPDYSSGYSEPLFRLLGAKEIDSMDYSDYEQATIIHDLNQPIPANLKNRFTAIVDGGTIEHVFNFPQAIRNCMEALQVGGHYIGITPANNQMGHGFYQFSPELYFNIMREENGFVMKKMILVGYKPDGNFSDWYEVRDPRTVKSRVTITNSIPTFIMVIAGKMAEREIFSTVPQQSDYETTWQIHSSLKESQPGSSENKLKFFYRKYTPRRIKILAHNIYNLFTRERVVDRDLGEMNPGHFRKVDVKHIK